MDLKAIVGIVAEQDESDEERLTTHEYLTRMLRLWDTWPDVTFPGMPNGDALAREYVETVRELVSRPLHESN